MKPILTTFLAVVLFSGMLRGQNAHFVYEGVIEFDKSVNTYALMKKSINKDNESYMNPAFEQYKKTQPQFKVMKSTMNFSRDKSLFVPEKEELAANNYFNDPSATQPNTTFTDLAASSSTTQKNVFEELFLVRDSLRKINWKITTETRDIAGYTCRRANAIILDSIYVVAFYTDLIPVSSGPESFTGLPGMILGVALPHENITWFASKVTEKQVLATAVAPPKKGKPLDNKGLRTTLQNALKSWGTYAQSSFKAFLL